LDLSSSYPGEGIAGDETSSFNWLLLDEIHIAEQLARLHWDMLRAIKPREIVLWATKKNKVCYCVKFILERAFRYSVEFRYVL
tara:strand:+ start:129 stop:377 length:249 start_codon:yes stop_codon:yes gene_type:complete